MTNLKGLVKKEQAGEAVWQPGASRRPVNSILCYYMTGVYDKTMRWIAEPRTDRGPVNDAGRPASTSV